MKRFHLNTGLSGCLDIGFDVDSILLGICFEMNIDSGQH